MKSEKEESGTPDREKVQSEAKNQIEKNSVTSREEQVDVRNLARIENYLKKNYLFRINIVTSTLEMAQLPVSNYRPMSDYDYNSVLRDITSKGISCTVSTLRTLLLSNFTPKFDPFVDYLNSLPKYDGFDYIQSLCDTVHTTNKKLWELCTKKWLVALVASLMDEDVVNHTVLVFNGRQGIGKTSWILGLVPKSLKCYCYSGSVNPNNKDTLIQLSECMLINLDELDNLGNSRLSELKEMITKASIRFRRPYGFNQEVLPRRASFAGSVNTNEFLTDTTGSRRFLCFEVNVVNYKHSVPIDMVYAQALHLYRQGFQYWFSKEEILEISKSNEQFRQITIEEQYLIKYFEPCEKHDVDRCTLTTTEILNYLRDTYGMPVHNGSIMKLGQALNLHKFEKVTADDRKAYVLKQKASSNALTEEMD